MADEKDTATGAGPRKRIALDWRAGLGIAISIFLLWLAFRKTNFRDVLREVRTVDPLLLLLATAACTFVFWLRAWRWKSILEPLKPGIPFRSRFASVAIGFAGNNILPARVGEFLRAYSLSRMEKVPLVGSFSSLVMERLLDGIMVVVFLFSAMALPSFPELHGTSLDFPKYARGAGIFVGIGLVGLLLLVFFPRPAVTVVERFVQLLPRRVRRPIIDALEAFLTGVGILRNPVLLARATAWSVLVWLANSLGFYLALRAFHFDLPFSAGLFLNSCIALAVSTPSGPGYVGTYHYAAAAVLGLWGIDQAAAVAYALTFHLAGYIPITTIGVYYAWRTGLTMGEVKRSEETVEVAVEKETGADTIIERRRKPR
jgi:glycosyltransferase 2 family protein